MCDPLEWNAHQALAAWTSRKCDPFRAGILSIARRQYSPTAPLAPSCVLGRTERLGPMVGNRGVPRPS